MSQQEDDLITFTPFGEQQVLQVQGAVGNQEQPKRQRSPRKKKKSEWTLNQRQFDQKKTQEISHISPRERLNVFNGEEPSVLYLQLPVKRREENHFCTRCGEMGHGKHYCQAATWCKFCTSDTHATQACRKYEKFVRDNPIASSRRNTPVQEQKIAVNIQESNQRPLFPNPPVQCFNAPVILQIGTNNLAPQAEEHESREHSQKSPPNQIKETRVLMSAQLPHQRSCQDVHMDPRYQKPPHYAEIHHHRPVPQTPVEINEIGPTIQQGVIQRPVQRDTQATRSRRSTPPMNTQQTTSVPNLWITGNGGTRERDRLPKQEGDPNPNDYVVNCIHENTPLTLNDVARPVFVNHYYVGEAFIPATSKKLIKLDECDVSTENSLRNVLQQGTECEAREHSQNLRMAQQQTGIEKGQLHENGHNRDLHSDLREDSRNSLRMMPVSRKAETIQKERNVNRGIHSEFTEHSQQSLGTLHIGRSRVQATDQINTQQIPLTGFENFCQELQTYPVSRDPMTVQPTGMDNVSSSAILDLPNVNINLPPSLLPNPGSHRNQHQQVHQMEVTNPGQVTNSEILKSIQSIMEVMQQQLMLNSKTTEQGIVQMASLFQEMIKAQEKRDLDPALLVIPTFLGEASDRPQCLDWVSRVKNVCDRSGCSFRQELIKRQEFWCKTLSGVLMKGSLTMNLQRKFYSFSVMF